MIKIVSRNGDWEEVYINDELVYEGHSIGVCHWVDILRKLGIEAYHEEIDEDDLR